MDWATANDRHHWWRAEAVISEVNTTASAAEQEREWTLTTCPQRGTKHFTVFPTGFGTLPLTTQQTVAPKVSKQAGGWMETEKGSGRNTCL